MPGGYHNGFNPFRDAHGRWATPAGHAADIHGPPGAPRSLGNYDNAISPAALAAVDRRQPPPVAFIGRDLVEPLRAVVGDASAPQSTHAILTKLAAATGEKAQIHALMLKVAGQQLPKNVTTHDLIDLMDKIEQAPSELRAGRELLGTAVAIAAGHGDRVAAVLAGPDSPAWAAAKQQLIATAGPAHQGIDYARRAAQVGVDLTAPLTPRDRSSAIYNARMNEIGGKYDHVVMSEIYTTDKPYLMQQAYDGSMWGAHVGNYLHAMGDI